LHIGATVGTLVSRQPCQAFLYWLAAYRNQLVTTEAEKTLCKGPLKKRLGQNRLFSRVAFRSGFIRLS
jgi:hypothetical protein